VRDEDSEQPHEARRRHNSGMRRWVAVATGFLTMLVGAFLDRRGLGTWALGQIGRASCRESV